MESRRQFLETTSAAAVAGSLTSANSPAAYGDSSNKKKRLAVVTTVWRYLSHAQHITDRFLVGYPHEGEWHYPNMQVVSLYVDQKPRGDQSAERARRFGFKVYPSIQKAVCQGGDELAVDAVLIIGEHGNYPRNNKGQILYPRFEFFEQVTKVFARSGRSVPVFNDKHLSYSFKKASKMVAASKRQGFPMLAGSSLPVTWRLPDLELPWGCRIDEALMVGVGSSDSSDYHALEAMQCMLERRRGGETGVANVRMITGDEVWKAGEQGVYSRDLLAAALSRNDVIMGKSLVDARTQDLLKDNEIRRIVPQPSLYTIRYRDGLKANLLMVNGAVGDFSFAARVNGKREIQSTQFLLPPKPNVTYSACLAAKIEEMIETGKAPYPVERTLIVSGILESCLDSKIRGHRQLHTPHLNVRYQAPRESQYCRS